jgi:predicted dehydrogenase
MPSPSQEKIRYAVVGLGYFAQSAALPAFKLAKKNSKLCALVSGDSKKLKVLGEKYKVPLLCSYDDYDHLLRSKEIDAVYISLPNHMHADFSIRAARAGVHVLCEKPMARNVEECQQMIQAARSNNVRLMIAYRLHFQKANMMAVEIANSGKLGKLRYFSSCFSFQLEDRDNIRLKEHMAGGPLYDIGIYCLNAARYLFRQEPSEVMAFAASGHNDSRFAEVDEMLSIMMRIDDDQLAQFTCSFGAADASSFELVGTKGRLRLDNAYESDKMEMTIHLKNKISRKRFSETGQFSPELLYFSHCILKNTEPEPSGAEGLADVRVIQALQESIRQGKPIRLDAFDKKSHPGSSMIINRPTTPNVKLLHATPPH